MSFDRVLRDLRRRRKLSQSDLARRAYLSQSTISRLESGRLKPDQPSAEILDTILEADGRLVTSASSGQGLLDADEEARLAAVAENPRRTDRKLIEILDSLLLRMRRLTTEEGTAALTRSALARLHFIEALVRESRGDLRPEVISCGARWAHYLSWLHLATGRSSGAEHWSTRSMEWCIEADDAPMMFTVLQFRSHIALTKGHGARSVGLSEAAQRNPSVHPTQLAYAVLQEAWGHAILGNADLVDRKLGAANDVLTTRESSLTLPYWGQYWSEGFWLTQQGRVYRTLGHIDKAAELMAAGSEAAAKDPHSPDWWRRYCRTELKDVGVNARP